MPTKEQELAKLRAEIARLQIEGQNLEALKQAKIQKLRTQISNLPKQFGARHPVVSALLGNTYNMGKEAAQRIAKADFSEDTSRMNNLEYVSWLAKQLAKKPQNKRLAEA